MPESKFRISYRRGGGLLRLGSPKIVDGHPVTENSAKKTWHHTDTQRRTKNAKQK